MEVLDRITTLFTRLSFIDSRSVIAAQQEASRSRSKAIQCKGML